MMEKLTAFAKTHPTETALLGGVALIALYFVFFSGGSSSSGNSEQAALQNAYFQAEGLQAQSGAAIQVANINANAATSLAQIQSANDQFDNSTWATADQAINASNNQAATAALPYAEESNLISALAGVSSQTVTTSKQSSSGGFLGIGAGSSSKTTTQPTSAALNAAQYLEELAAGNGSYAIN
jgi:hypothetical protein